MNFILFISSQFTYTNLSYNLNLYNHTYNNTYNYTYNYTYNNTYNDTYNNAYNTSYDSLYNNTYVLKPMKPKICQHASRIKNCSNILRLCQTSNPENREDCLESALYLSSDKKYYRGYNWTLFFSLHYKRWIIQNCDNGVSIIASQTNAKCPFDISQNNTWKFEGDWGKSRPFNNTKFMIEDDSLYDWKNKLLQLTQDEKIPFIVEENIQLKTVNTFSIIPLEENTIKYYDTPLERLLKRIKQYKLTDS